MANKDLQNPNNEREGFESEILRNDDVNPNDSAVVVDEEDRTVLLTEDETIIVEKEESYSVIPRNRPRKVYSGMWGVPEIATFGLALFALLSVLLVYLFFVLPTQNNLEENRAKRDQLEKELIPARKKYGNITDTETQVAKLVTSVSDFESRFLKTENVGKASIYQRINGLINAYGLSNTTGPDYVPLEISEEERRRGTDSQAQRGRSKFQSLFPGVYVTMTVEGSYGNLRRFMQAVETSNEFLIISSVELEPAEENESDDGNDTIIETITNEQGQQVQVRKKAPPRGKTRGRMVSLRLEMAAYFQRPADQRANTAIPDAPLEDLVQ